MCGMLLVFLDLLYSGFQSDHVEFPSPTDGVRVHKWFGPELLSS